MQPYVTTPALAMQMLLATAVAVSLGHALAAARRGVATPGWRQVGPGGLHWFAALGSAAFCGLLVWVWLFVGSGRADAAFQMRVAYGLSFAFGLAAIGSGLGIARLYRQRMRWRGSDELFAALMDALAARDA